MEDLSVAKLVAFRAKDRNFVAALLHADLVDADLIASRLQTMPREHVVASEAAFRWLSAPPPARVVDGRSGPA